MESMLFGLSLVFNIVAVIVIRNLLLQNDALEDLNTKLVGTLNDMQTGIAATIERMREIDLRGAFEANDQVGFVFRAMLGMVNELEKFLESVDATE